MRSSLCSILALMLFLVSVPPAARAADVTVPRVAPGTVATLPVVKTLSVASGINPTGGQEASGWVELSGPAPCFPRPCGRSVTGQTVGGMSVLLSSGNLAIAKVPQVIEVPIGKTYQAFTLITFPVPAATSVVISAWREGSPAQTATITVVPPVLTSVTLDQASVTGGTVVHGTAHFSGPRASANPIVAVLSSNNSAAATLPPSVTLDVNKTTVLFDIQTLGVANNTQAAISATYAGATKSASLTVAPAALKEIVGGNCYTGCGADVSLTGPAPPGGAMIQLKSGNPSLLPLPATVTIPAQQVKTHVDVSVPAQSSSTSIGISASYSGVTRTGSVYVMAVEKPDLVIKSVSLQDRFGNPITKPQDSQPFKMCIAVAVTPDVDSTNPTLPTYPPPASALHVSYLGPTGIGTSVGREYDITVDFSAVGGGLYRTVTPCTELPGLQPGGYYDVTLTADFYNKVVERNEGNNTYKLRITR